MCLSVSKELARFLLTATRDEQLFRALAEAAKTAVEEKGSLAKSPMLSRADVSCCELTMNPLDMLFGID